jgi:crotonobetainyl-CoA:carnitine CoA-transferase CaiB-like acyl-CoA transferase
MARLGLQYEALAEINPRLIYVGVFGYGQDGPYAAKPAYDDLIQGVIGLPSLIAQVGDGVPRYVPLAFVDRTVGLAAVNAVTAALYRREKTGRGQRIDVPMFETMVPFIQAEHMAGGTFSPPLGPAGYPRLLARERTPFPTKDGHVCALIYNDKQWRSFFNLIGDPGRFDRDPRLANIGVRTQHIGALYAEVAEVLRTRTTAEWLEALERADIPAVPLHTLESLLDDPHLKAIGYFETVEHPSEGTIRQMTVPGTWSESKPGIRRLAPKLGQHSAEVLAEAGYSPDEIARMLAAGVTRQAQ